jgi:hypothetical protein
MEFKTAVRSPGWTRLVLLTAAPKPTQPSRCTPRIFFGGGRADPEAIYNLFDFKNYVIKIML